jgi:hypothetical protein
MTNRIVDFSRFRIKIIFTLGFELAYCQLQAQNFYKENQPKTITIQVGLGAGTFYPAPRPYTDSLMEHLMPILSFGIEKRIASHLSVKSQASFQAFGSSDYSKSTKTTTPLDQGISYSFELTPTFNLLPNPHHLFRPKLDINLGVGIGYLATYRAEKFNFQGKDYTFHFLEHSPFIPIRSSLIYRLNNQSDVAIEGVFFRTWLDKSNSSPNFNLQGNHFAQANLVYRWWIK